MRFRSSAIDPLNSALSLDKSYYCCEAPEKVLWTIELSQHSVCMGVSRYD